MQITVNGVQIFYCRQRNGDCSKSEADAVRAVNETRVILLHGWGGSASSMQGIYEFLGKKGCDVINIDLPGFGQSSTPPATFTIEDYALCVKELMEKLEFNDATLIGHSFGGRIAILLGAGKNVKNLVLTSAAGIKPRFSLKKTMRIRGYKRAVKRGKDTSSFGSTDYKALNGDMRKVFVRVVNRHLDEDVKKINVPTLLIWGKRDDQTPLYMAKKIKRGISDCGLVLLDGGHFAYAERHNEFCAILSNFLNL